MQTIFTRPNISLALAGAFAAVSLVAAVACGDSSNSSEATATPVKQQPTQIIEVQPTINPTQVSNLPTATPKASTSTPHVLWMAETHAGAGVISIDIETDVPTTVTLSMFAGHAGDPTQYPGPESDNALKTHHTVSVGTGGNPGIVHADVTDAQGKKTAANLGNVDRADGMYWRLGALAPKLSLTGPTAEVTWNTLRAIATQQVTPGSAVLLTKQAGCTTAQACLPTFTKSLPNTTVGSSTSDVADTHTLELTFPDTTHDYYLVLVGDSPDFVTEFYQFDVPATSFAKGG